MMPTPASVDPVAMVLRWISMALWLAVNGAETADIANALKPEILSDVERFSDPEAAIATGVEAIRLALVSRS